ncbi:ATP-binding protein [bacterium]|nr:ATP-binding protein [bacterium]
MLDMYRVVAILGPRQCGKTTLARQLNASEYYDLENPVDLNRFENPKLLLEDKKGLIVIDEVQRLPDLFELIRYLVDYHPEQTYLILGSASKMLIRQSSETLTGRIGYYHLGGFQFSDMDAEVLNALWLRGGFPLSFLAKDDLTSYRWRENYIVTFLERDLPQIGFRIPSITLRRFWTMLGHYHGGVVNLSDMGRSLGFSDHTIRHYIEILEGTFMIRMLQPWFVNMGKRLVKRPKIYFKDSGIFHSLMTIQNHEQLGTFPRLGASWEGFALESVCRMIEPDVSMVYFWGTHQNAEVDLFWRWGGKNWAMDFKYMDAPKITKSIRIALEDLNLAHLWIVYPGKERYLLNKKVTALPLEQIGTKEFLK